MEVKLKMIGTKEKLKEFMDIFGDNLTKLADYLGISYQSISKKLNGHTDFKLTEIRMIKERYNLTAEEVDYIFFYIPDAEQE